MTHFQSKTSQNLQIKICLFTSNIETLLHSFANSICTASRRSDILTGKTFIWTKTSKREQKIYSNLSTAKTKNRKRSKFNSIEGQIANGHRLQSANKYSSLKLTKKTSKKCVNISSTKINALCRKTKSL